jgi:hypothetical protein
MAAVCEKKLPDGSNCDVQAIGRCKICGEAFCQTHQGREDRGFREPYVDRCAACVAQAQADELEQQRKWQAEDDEAREYLQSGSARTALLTAGVPPVKIYQTERKEKKKWVFGSSQWVEVVTSIQHGWLLGDLSGEYTVRGDGFPSVHRDSGLAALLDIDKGVLTRVEPYLDSYKQVEYLRDKIWKIPDNSFYILIAEEAVKGLIESSRRGIQNVFTRRIPDEHDNFPEPRQALAGKSGFIRIEEGKEPGRMYEIHKATLSIGGNAEGDLFFENSSARQLQATVINQGNGNYALRVEFLTQINGQPLNKSRFFPLQEGDHIKLGRTVLVFGTK